MREETNQRLRHDPKWFHSTFIDTTWGSIGRAGKVMQSKRAGQHVLWLKVHEHKTTVSCCACGQDTTKAALGDGKLSGRLRSCTGCNDGGNRLRDRDVQAARNMLWLASHMYFDQSRPEYMSRSRPGATP